MRAAWSQASRSSGMTSFASRSIGVISCDVGQVHDRLLDADPRELAALPDHVGGRLLSRREVHGAERGALDRVEVAAELVAVAAEHVELPADLRRRPRRRTGCRRRRSARRGAASSSRPCRRSGSADAARERLRHAERLGQRVVLALEGRDLAPTTSASRCAASPRAARSARASGGNGTPRPRCSRSNQAAPMPSIARPPESTSSVVTVFTSTPGWRYVTPVTIVPSRTRSRHAPRGTRARCSPRACRSRPGPPAGSGRSGPSPRRSRSRPRRRRAAIAAQRLRQRRGSRRPA